MPELEMAAPGDVGSGEDGDAAGKIEEHAEIATVEAVDEHAAEKGHEQSGKRDDDDLQADLDRRMGGGEDVPADGGEVQAAAEERDQHGGKEKTEAALLPDEL